MSHFSIGPPNRNYHPAIGREKTALLPALTGKSFSILSFVSATGNEAGFANDSEDCKSVAIGGWIKRALDITLALTMLVLLAPLVLIVALLLGVTTSGRIFYSQQRVGLHRRSFPCFKFCTMVENADVELRYYLARNPDVAREWSERQKLEHDPRITWLGGLLRKSSIDELPQLLNVLRGDMSLVGPRPVLANELNRYGEYQKYYLAARPGLTGMWQVSGRDRRSYKNRVALDCYYARRWSLLVDLVILIRTIPAVLKFADAS